MKYAIQVAIGLTAVYSATSVKTLPGERYALGAVFVVILLAVLGKGERLPPKMIPLIFLWIGGTLVYLIVGVVVSRGLVSYVVGDAFLALLPIMFAIAFAKHPSWLRSESALLPLLFVLAIAAVTARTVGMLGSRHEAPSSLLIVGCWYYAIQARTLRYRLLMLAATLAVLDLAYTSGYRTHMLLWAAAPALVVGLMRGARAALLTAVATVILAVPLTYTPLGADVVAAFSSSRLETLVAERPDESADTRIGEFRDVISTARDEWLPGQFIVGAGFGSSYQPKTTFILANADASGRVHNIHIGIALVFFRFGLLGIVLFISLIVVALRALAACRRSIREGLGASPVISVGGLGLLLFTGEFMTLNASVQPSMSFCAGIVIAAVMTRSHSDSDAPRSSPIPNTRIRADSAMPRMAP